MLIAGTDVLIRRRAVPGDGPWVIAFSGIDWPRAWGQSDDGWRVHDAGDGLVMLESLTRAGTDPTAFLWGNPSTKTVEFRDPATQGRDGLCWRSHPALANTFRLECISAQPGSKWLGATTTNWMRLSDLPEGRSSRHEFVALPLADKERFDQAEEVGDYSFMADYEMAADGWLNEVPRPAAETTALELTPQTPRERAGTDVVALELVAALQPSFDDGAGGAENSDYHPDDPRRIGWPHNILSLDTVATSTGIVRLGSDDREHQPDPRELARCRQLAAAVTAALGAVRPFGGDHPTPFLPFYLVADKRDPVPEALTPEVVRAAFRGAIFPETPIDLEPITEAFVANDREGWADVVRWIASQADLAQVSYVSIGYDTGQEPNYAAVFPRLVLGITKAGSLVGACGTVVQA